VSRYEWQALTLIIYVLVILPASLIAIIVLVAQNLSLYLAALAVSTFIGMLFTGEFFPPHNAGQEPRVQRRGEYTGR